MTDRRAHAPRTIARGARIAVLAAFVLGPVSTFAARARAVSPTQTTPASWRAAALASFDDVWQTVDDTFFDPAFGGVDWPAVRRELRPQVESAPDEAAAREIVRAMLARLHESHFVILSASADDADVLPGEGVVPIDVRMLPAGVVVTRVNDDATRRLIAPGAIVTSIDDQPTADWLRKAAGADARARDLAVWQRVNRSLHGAPGSMAHLRLRTPDGRDVAADVRRTVPAGEVVTVGNLPPLHVVVSTASLKTPRGRPVGFIGFNYWMTTVDHPMALAIDRFRHDAGVVIDLRGNPGGLAGLMRGIAGQIFDDPVTLGTSRTREASLVFTANPRRAMDDGRSVTPFGGPVAILVDGMTGSTSECFAAALQSLHRARIFGQPTMGEALPAMTKRLPDGDVLMYAVGDFVTSTGHRVEGSGVLPDVNVPLTIPDLAAGRDRTLEAALAWFDEQSPR